MTIPDWVFDECVKLGYCKRIGAGRFQWDNSTNPAWMIYKLILIDRKRRKLKAAIEKGK